MSRFQINAQKAELCGEIYECYAEIQAKYFFGTIDGQEAVLLLPYFPCGILCGLSVVCDGEEFASAKAVNIREITQFPSDSYIFLERLENSIFALKLKGIYARSCLEISITVCLELNRHGRHMALALSVPLSLGPDYPLSAEFNIYGEVEKVLCPGHTVTETVRKGFCRVAVAGIISPQFILDIFFKACPLNKIFISRQPLQKNIGLCSFVPKLEKVRKTKRKFDICLSFEKGNRSEIISALAVVLECIGKSDFFRLTIGRKSTDFALPNSKNIDRAMAMACENQAEEEAAVFCGDWNTILICSGAVFDPNMPLSGTPMVILSGNAPWGRLGENIVFTAGNESQFVIPVRFSAIYEKQLQGTTIKPVGGLSCELLWDSEKSPIANSVFNCFALHDIIPPSGFQIFNKNKQLVEEIAVDDVKTHSSLRIVNLMYWWLVMKKRKAEEDLAAAESRCLFRNEINEISLKNQIAFEDIVLVCVANGQEMGLLSSLPPNSIQKDITFYEGDKLYPEPIIELILKSQTIDGIIADTALSQPSQLIFSTAVCLIALYFHTGTQYKAFARRSLEFLSRQKGFWAKTALALWNSEEIDSSALDEKLEMKIMCEQLHELAVLLIKNYRRKIK